MKWLLQATDMLSLDLRILWIIQVSEALLLYLITSPHSPSSLAHTYKAGLPQRSTLLKGGLDTARSCFSAWTPAAQPLGQILPCEPPEALAVTLG